jgi:hypothetical protein
MKLRLVALGCAVLLAIAACSGNGDDQAAETTTSVDRTTSTTSDTAPRLLGRALGTTGNQLAPTGEGDGPAPPPQESFEPGHNVEPIESAVPMFEG